MTEVYWTPEAKRCLKAIQAYIAKDSPVAARGMVERILERSRQLEELPLIGRKVPDYRKEKLRELLERPYRIIYQVSANAENVAILSVMHYQRLLPEDPEQLTGGE